MIQYFIKKLFDGKKRGCIHNKSRQCATCSSQKYRSKDPMRYAYNNLKHNVYRRKGRAWFYLTFEEFKEFAIETHYIGRKGITKVGYHIDRIDDEMGYFIGNIQPLTNVLNLAKRYKKLHYDWDEEQGKMVAYVSTMKIEDVPDEDLPFPIKK